MANSDIEVTGSITGVTGDDVSVTCNQGFSGGGEGTCQSDGNFYNRYGDKCMYPRCIEPSFTSIDGPLRWSSCEFCLCCWTAPSHETVTCGSDGSFNETVTCVAATCSAIVVNNSNSIINDTTYDGTGAQTTTPECNDGFSGGGTYTCSASGTNS